MAFIAILSFLIPNLASAQGNLGSHYRETVLNFSGTPLETQYLVIPRVSWPVHVLVSGVRPNGDVFVVTNFVVADSPFAGYDPIMTVPSMPLVVPGGGQPVTCAYIAAPPASAECLVTGNVTIGTTESSSSQPHKIFIRLQFSGEPTVFRVTMWY